MTCSVSFFSKSLNCTNILLDITNIKTLNKKSNKTCTLQFHRKGSNITLVMLCNEKTLLLPEETLKIG